MLNVEALNSAYRALVRGHTQLKRRMFRGGQVVSTVESKRSVKIHPLVQALSCTLYDSIDDIRLESSFDTHDHAIWYLVDLEACDEFATNPPIAEALLTFDEETEDAYLMGDKARVKRIKNPKGITVRDLMGAYCDLEPTDEDYHRCIFYGGIRVEKVKKGIVVLYADHSS